LKSNQFDAVEHESLVSGVLDDERSADGDGLADGCRLSDADLAAGVRGERPLAAAGTKSHEDHHTCGYRREQPCEKPPVQAMRHKRAD
jgi:hypothetical protein